MSTFSPWKFKNRRFHVQNSRSHISLNWLVPTHMDKRIPSKSCSILLEGLHLQLRGTYPEDNLTVFHPLH